MKTITKLIILSVVLITPVHAIQRQEKNNWCWAACIQDAMAQAGVRKSQTEIVARMTGWVANRPASVLEVRDILKSYRFRAVHAGRPGSPKELFNTLKGGWKVIAFVRPTNGKVGHFIMLQEIEPKHGGIIVSDPWTGKTRPYTLHDLYRGWRWGDSIVVGKPMK